MMHPLVRQIADLQRKREALRAKLATVTNDLAEVDTELLRVANLLTERGNPAPLEP